MNNLINDWISQLDAYSHYVPSIVIFLICIALKVGGMFFRWHLVTIRQNIYARKIMSKMFKWRRGLENGNYTTGGKDN